MKWSLLGFLGTSQVAKATVLIPLVGYLVLFNASFMGWLRLDARFEAPMAELQVEPSAEGTDQRRTTPEGRSGQQLTVMTAVERRLLMLYFGLTAVACATILFGIRAFPEHKRYADARDYARDSVDFYTSDAVLDSLKRELTTLNGNTDSAPMAVRQALTGELSLLDDSGWPKDSARLRETVMRCLMARYNLLDYARRPARLAITALYVVGLVLLGVPAATLFFRVVSVVLDTWFR